MKKILLINGHPSGESFSAALLKSYKLGAEKKGAECEILDIRAMSFNPILADDYKKREVMGLEEDVLKAQQLIQWADHLVFAYPTWWGSMPALTKGFVDRVFLPGFAFKHRKGKNFPVKLLKEKSIRLLVTMDAPKWWFYIVYGAAQYRMLRQLVFGYVGFNPVKFSTYGSVRKSTEKQRLTWLHKTEKLGKQLK